MKKNFLDIVAKASANKDRFDSSVDSIKEKLDVYVKGSKTVETTSHNQTINATGWLRGALSYPWAIICLVIPAILDIAL